MRYGGMRYGNGTYPHPLPCEPAWVHECSLLWHRYCNEGERNSVRHCRKWSNSKPHLSTDVWRRLSTGTLPCSSRLIPTFCHTRYRNETMHGTDTISKSSDNLIGHLQSEVLCVWLPPHTHQQHITLHLLTLPTLHTLHAHIDHTP